MLQNQQLELVAKIGFGTVENKPPKVSLKWDIDPLHPPQNAADAAEYRLFNRVASSASGYAAHI